MRAFVTGTLGVSDPLYSLVAFHGLFNGIGLILSLPLIRPLTRWLETRFLEHQAPLLRHINTSAREVPEAAVESIRRETYRLIDQAAGLNQMGFGLPPDFTFYHPGDDRASVPVFAARPDFDRCYSHVKRLKGEILRFALLLQRQSMEAEEARPDSGS